MSNKNIWKRYLYYWVLFWWVVHSHSKMPDCKDLYHAGEVRRMTIGEIKRLCKPGEITEKEFEKITGVPKQDSVRKTAPFSLAGVNEGSRNDNAARIAGYLISKNKGYGTKDHLLAIKLYGITDFHRKSYNIKVK